MIFFLDMLKEINILEQCLSKSVLQMLLGNLEMNFSSGRFYIIITNLKAFSA